MRRAVHALILAAAGSVLALACRHEATTPPSAPIRDVETRPLPARLASPPPAGASSADPCIEVDSELGGTHITLEGRVSVDDAFEHPARGKTHPYILTLDAPRCAVGIDETAVRELHLTSTEGLALKPFVGAHVRVSGDPFAAHTAWHARPIVLVATSARALSR